MRRMARTFLLLALALSIGLQWALVQGAAWVGMVIRDAGQASLVQAVARAIDGKHPCRWCQAAQQGESSRKDNEADRSGAEMVLAAPECDRFIAHCGMSICEPARLPDFAGWMQPPPSPPPRAA